ncbi:hypothetical protein GQ53DRAFT_428295 [Thozetella sp. PMI_491]|nr:hypothetical protein GQ53DRAFT_428295 [Thozetella sp. PMI_491]
MWDRKPERTSPLLPTHPNWRSVEPSPFPTGLPCIPGRRVRVMGPLIGLVSRPVSEAYARAVLASSPSSALAPLQSSWPPSPSSPPPALVSQWLLSQHLTSVAYTEFVLNEVHTCQCKFQRHTQTDTTQTQRVATDALVRLPT